MLSERRSITLPDVPATVEAGVPQLQSPVWFGVVGPAGAPKGMVERVAAEVRNLSDAPAFRGWISGLGGEPLQGGLDLFAKVLNEEYRKRGEIVKISGANVD